MLARAQIINNHMNLAGNDEKEFARFLVVMISSDLLRRGFNEVNFGPRFLRDSEKATAFVAF